MASLAAGLANGAAVRHSNGSACDQLAAKFPGRTFSPSSDNYTTEAETNIWSLTCVMSPGCVFTPANANDVASAINIIRDTKSTFSVKSGGHMPVHGAQSNDGGVMISMTDINTKTLSKDKSVASIGPGNIWVDVYSWLAKNDIAVAGGRYSNVGVGGLLVSGGISYFGNKVGWSVNTITGMQVVLGNGKIVEVNEKENKDLFWALKGGSNNFGIVTRYDMKTLPQTAAYGGLEAWVGENATSVFIDAVQAFLESPEGIEDIDTEANPSITLIPGSGTWEPVLSPYVSGNYSASSPPSLVNFTSIPNPALNTLQGHDSWVNVPISVQEDNTEDANGQGQIFGCLSAKIAPGLVQLAVDTVLKPALTDLANVTDAFVAVSPEPVSTKFLTAARNSGEYAIDLGPENGPFVILLTTVTWKNSADDETVYAFMNKTLTNLEAVLTEKDLKLPFIYLGDAAPGQYPFSTYGNGNGENVARLKKVQAAYDTNGVFRNLITSGFKL
ncbi:hypothetical protein M426DRAFT_59313 [Hypoxylon sp. CI-4A]|nr:hypothetical protein M426DRAFT_59313 [Hypoxylon sp. CI-4A]